MEEKSRHIAIMLDLQWPYKRHGHIFAGVQQFAEGRGWHSTIDEFVHVTLSSNSRKTIPYHGIIARGNKVLQEQASRLRIPVVNVWASSPAHHLFPGVFPDSTLVGRMIAEHLLARGFRRFATLTAPKNIEHDMEVNEFASLIGEAGFTCASEKIPQNPWRDHDHWRKTQRLIQRWMDGWQLPIGVYVGLEGCGRMVVQECHRRGWRVPADVAMIAGKNEETLCEHPRPSLTSIEIGYDRIGYEAARLLEQLMEGKPGPEAPILIPPQGLIVRESTDFIAVENELVASALEFISLNSHRRIGPDNVAQSVGAETRTLQNHFQKVLKRPIATEIRRVRMERAKRELAQSDRPLSEIASDAGFGDTQRLYEVFRRELGVSPSEYRKQRQVENAK